MNKDIKSLLVNTFGTILCLLVIFFFVTYILFLHNGVQGALKESWSASLTFFSVLATLGAAVIAAYLFNDWRTQADHQTNKELIYKIKSIDSLLNDFIFNKMEILSEMTDMYKAQSTGLPPKHKEYRFELFRIHNNTLRNLMEIKLEVQNYGFVADKTELTEKMKEKIVILETSLEKLFKPFEDNLAINSSDFYSCILAYKPFIGSEIPAQLYEHVTYPLLSKLPSITPRSINSHTAHKQ